ncbi:MAG UNVERIFIED_CONTAM: insulinase family protein [Anaerolineae bacterium]
MEDLNMATVEEITAFHETYYVPNNASLAVVGDLDLEQTRELIDQFFAPIPRGEEPPALPEFVPQPQAEAEIITVKDDLINIPAVLIGYETIPYAHPDYPALSLATYILSVGTQAVWHARWWIQALRWWRIQSSWITWVPACSACCSSPTSIPP